MKKVFLTIMLLAAMSLNMQAQEVFNEVVKIAKANAEDQSKSLETRRSTRIN